MEIFLTAIDKSPETQQFTNSISIFRGIFAHSILFYFFFTFLHPAKCFINSIPWDGNSTIYRLHSTCSHRLSDYFIDYFSLYRTHLRRYHHHLSSIQYFLAYLKNILFHHMHRNSWAEIEDFRSVFIAFCFK